MDFGEIAAAHRIGIAERAQRRLRGRDLAVDEERGGARIGLDVADARLAFPVEEHGQARAGDDGDRHQDGDGHEDQVMTGFHQALIVIVLMQTPEGRTLR